MRFLSFILLFYLGMQWPLMGIYALSLFAIYILVWAIMMLRGHHPGQKWYALENYRFSQTYRYFFLSALLLWGGVSLGCIWGHYYILSLAHLAAIEWGAAVTIPLLLWFLDYYHDISPRRVFDRMSVMLATMGGLVTILVTITIVAILVAHAWKFFELVPVGAFLSGLYWSPQSADMQDVAGLATSFGAVPVFSGTLLITMISMIVAVPLGLYSAVFMAEYLSASGHTILKPIIEILAGIPTIVYGYIAATTIGPFVRDLARHFGYNVATESAIAAGLVMGVMIIPYILSLSDEAIRSVPHNLREASLALGATKAETIRRVVVPAATPGIMAAVILAFSRAIGETMIVTMAAGFTAHLTANPLASVTTVTVQIVSLLTGDQEFDNPKTLAAYGLGLTLFIITFALNYLAQTITRRSRRYNV